MSDVATIPHLDRGEGVVHFERRQDVEPILHHNKALQAMPQKSDFMRQIANIPCVILEKWANEDGAHIFKMPRHEYSKYIRRKLNDPEWRYLRVEGPSSRVFWTSPTTSKTVAVPAPPRVFANGA